MSTQYNQIQAPYDYIRTVSIALIEHENVAEAIQPYIKGARVLELACGSGFYTYSFLKWGAQSVTAVDISSAMIDQAKSQRPVDVASDQVNFLLADCARPTSYEGGPFDIVFGAWLLNYAPDRASLTEMFTNISRNLKPSGHLVSVTVPPDNDPRRSIDAERKIRPREEGGSGLLFYEILEEVQEGYRFRAHGDTPVGNFHFDCYHLRADTYQQCAKEAGLTGHWQWDVTKVPDRYLLGQGEGGSSLKEITSYQMVPNYGILVAGKGL